MKPIEIRIQNCSLHAGITANPLIAWEYGSADAGKVQQACRIRLLREGRTPVYDTDWQETAAQNNHLLPVMLESHTRYVVEVSVRDGQEEAAGCSAPYVSGVAREEDWHGGWIGSGAGAPFYCLKRLTVPEHVSEAYLSVAATGQYECRIDGKLPDDSVLNGSWTDFHKRIHYRTFDILPLLTGPEACLSVEVGNGWYYGYSRDGRHFYTLDKGYEPFGKTLGIRAVVTLRLADGSVLRLGSDESWEIAASAVTYTNIYGSEDWDLALDSRPWANPAATTSPARFLGASAPKGRLVPALYPPVKRLRTYEGRRVWTYENGDTVYDLGQNMAGQFEITLTGPAGAGIRVACAETWRPGEAFTPKTNAWCDCRLADAGDRPQTFCPKFTYGAGRYLCLSRGAAAEAAAVLGVRGHFISSAARPTGTFACSDYRYMQVHDLVRSAVESNLQHVHTDCPTVERLGWQEPNHLMAPSIMYLKEVNTLWEKFEDDQADSQYPEGEYDTDHGAFAHQYGPGLLPSIAPRYARFLVDGGVGSFWDIIPWGSSLILGLLERRRFYGETGDRAAYYPVMARYVEYEYGKYLQYPTLYGGPADAHFLRHGLGDWGTWKEEENARENVETAYLYQDLVQTAKLASELGDQDGAARYGAWAEALKRDYNAALLVQNDAGCWYYRAYQGDPAAVVQTNQALPLCFGMVPEDKISSVTESFLSSTADHRIKAGEIGLPYILRLLGELGQCDTVQDMILQNEHPSYYRFVEQRETTLPEFWDDQARSRNHDMMGSILEWLYRYMAGISSEDGYQTVRIVPQLPSGVQYVRCTYRSITGTVEVTAERLASDALRLRCCIPVNTTGSACINGRTYPLEGGITYLLPPDIQ